MDKTITVIINYNRKWTNNDNDNKLQQKNKQTIVWIINYNNKMDKQ